MSDFPRCRDCGRFCKPVAWKMIYSGAIPMPDHEIFKCAKCFESVGPFVPDSRIKPEHSCGVLK